MTNAGTRVAVFGITFVVMWLPWIGWFAFDTYGLSHHDTKFGRDWGFLFGVFLRGATAFVSAMTAALVHAFELRNARALPWRTRRRVVVIGACIMTALSPLAPRLYVPGLGGIAEIVVPWALLSAVVLAAIIATTRLLERGVPPNDEMQRTSHS
jgi:hypothetical protein